jgi:hypothetical protein
MQYSTNTHTGKTHIIKREGNGVVHFECGLWEWRARLRMGMGQTKCEGCFSSQIKTKPCANCGLVFDAPLTRNGYCNECQVIIYAALPQPRLHKPE